MKDRGFTIIEMIVYVGLLSILLAIMSQVFLATLGIRLESEGATSIQQDGRFILSRIAYDVRRASAIISPGIGSTGTTLRLLIPENGVDETYEYRVTDGTMMLTTGSVQTDVSGTGTNVSTFSVTRIGNSGQMENAKDTVQIVLSLSGSGEVSQGVQQLELQTTVGLR